MIKGATLAAASTRCDQTFGRSRTQLTNGTVKTAVGSLVLLQPAQLWCRLGRVRAPRPLPVFRRWALLAR